MQIYICRCIYIYIYTLLTLFTCIYQNICDTNKAHPAVGKTCGGNFEIKSLEKKTNKTLHLQKFPVHFSRSASRGRASTCK